MTVNCRRQSSTSEDEVEALGSSSRLFCDAVLLKGGMDFIEGKKKQRKHTHHDGKWSGVVPVRRKASLEENACTMYPLGSFCFSSLNKLFGRRCM